MDMLKDGIQFTAEVKRGGAILCRLSVARPDEDEAAARSALADKARLWIHDYLSRAG
ncbi:hypothetical protein [Variovorax sp. PBL-E5]|uniref:hypothetical protein n=1 Tax=Variovorax sp. PBL-E5 TaxID=434014 RepID=UPI0013185FF9|nr:hypothetical protein [Variovorax sp. PBL-E5]VTU30006.1 hypothetical protein E5CHR_02926 [Variovorax sp. PBL-E5]